MLIEIDICKEIKLHLGEQGRSEKWLAEQIGVNRSTLNRNLKKRSLDSDCIAAISNALSVCFFQRLADASAKSIEKQKKQ
jgi:lambda repressor-like predicted transcriptional regulator